MTATTSERHTQKRLTGQVLAFPLAAQKALTGTIAMLGSDGFVQMGAALPGAIGLGVFVDTIDNSAGDPGDALARIDRGTFRFDNSPDDAVTIGQYGRACYILDNQTVAATSGDEARPIAGIVRGVDAAGVWVEF